MRNDLVSNLIFSWTLISWLCYDDIYRLENWNWFHLNLNLQKHLLRNCWRTDLADLTWLILQKCFEQKLATQLSFFFLNDWLMSLNLCLVTVINWKRNSSGSFPKIIAKPFSDWTIVQHYTMHISVDYRPYEREISQRVIKLNVQWKRMTDCCWLCSVDIVLGIDAKKCSWVG